MPLTRLRELVPPRLRHTSTFGVSVTADHVQVMLTVPVAATDAREIGLTEPKLTVDAVAVHVSACASCGTPHHMANATKRSSANFMARAGR